MGRSQRPAVLQRLAHEGGVGHRAAVVAEGDDARLGQVAQLRHLLALPSLAHAADGQHAHRRRQRRRALYVLDRRPAVDGRVGVGHAADGREAAARRRQRARLDRLLVLEAGVAQMAVDVDQPWADDEPLRVDDPALRASLIVTLPPPAMRPSAIRTSPTMSIALSGVE